eukprot:Skav226927  [mRNA]  locus=scaffold3728:205215:206339:+ [translate_table: standard]
MNVERPAVWQYVPFKVVHPIHVPEALRVDQVVALMRTGPNETLLHSAIRAGTFLTLGQLHQIRGQLFFPLPSQGRGKKGRIIKHDVAEALVSHLFPEASAKEQLSMVAGIMGKQWRHLQPTKSSMNCGDILKAFNALDPEDMGEFSHLAACAADEIQLKERRDAQARTVQSTPSKKQHRTPSTLQDLVPLQGRLTRHPVLKRYQAFFTELNSDGGVERLHSHATYWDGKKKRMTEFQALKEAVSWMWGVKAKLSKETDSLQPSLDSN